MSTKPERPLPDLYELAAGIYQLREAITSTHLEIQQQLDAMDRRLRRVQSDLSQHTDFFHPAPPTSTRRRAHKP